MHWTVWLITAVLGFLVGAASADLDDQCRPRFDFRSILWAFVLSSALGMLAGETAGTRMEQVSGGRDPEYEIVDTRTIPDARRWQIAQSVSGKSLLPVSAGLLGCALYLAYRKRDKKPWTVEQLSRVRTVGVIWFVVTYFAVLRLAFEPLK